MTSTETSSLVLHGRRRASARLRDGAVLLETDGVRRRIPVTAIERVDVRGAKDRQLTVVLTGDEPVAYHLRCRSAPAVHEFAQAVRRALPIRDADEPRPNGAKLVTEKPLERAAPNRARLLWWGFGGGYVLVLALLLVKGLHVPGATEVAPGVFWAVAPLLIAGGVEGVRAGWQVFREPWVLRTRGSPSRESYRGPTGTRAASSTTTRTSTVTAYGVSARARTEVPSGQRSRTTL